VKPPAFRWVPPVSEIKGPIITGSPPGQGWEIKGPKFNRSPPRQGWETKPQKYRQVAADTASSLPAGAPPGWEIKGPKFAGSPPRRGREMNT
jgi:hypothetical protein